MDPNVRRRSPRVHARWAWAIVALFVASAATAVGCTSSDDPVRKGDVADAYAVVVRWFVDRSATEQERPVVYLEALGEGVGIGLETQAAVVAAIDEFGEARFVDDPSEALGDDGVRDDGLFIALGAAIEDGVSVTIDSDEIVSESTRTSWQFRLVFRQDEWTLSAEPVHMP